MRGPTSGLEGVERRFAVLFLPVAFGFGAHVCIGQHLSKLEMTVAWNALFDRLDNFRLACAPDELEYMPNILLRGLEAIPITYDVIG